MFSSSHTLPHLAPAMPPQSHSPSSTSSAPTLGSPGAALVRAAEVAARDPTNLLPLQPVASGSQSPPVAASASASSASTSQPKKRGRKRINEPLDNINGALTRGALHWL